MAIPQPASPDNPSANYQLMKSRWRAIRTPLGGTLEMRKAGKTYLPQHYREPDEAYADRLARAVLTNVVGDAVSTAIGRPFSQRATFTEAASARLKAYSQDIDLAGNSLHAFCRDSFFDGIVDGACFVLVDHSGAQGASSLAEERRSGARPYLTHIPASRMLAHYVETIGGKSRCVYVRILERVTERDGFTEKTFDQVKEIMPGQVNVYRKGTSGWELVEPLSGPYAIRKGVVPTRVPVFDFTAGNARMGPTLVDPPFLDLAHKNIEHWQASSDFRNIVTKTCYPMLAVSGADTPPATTDDDGGLAFGPDALLRTSEPTGKWYYVQPEASSFDALQEDMQNMLNDMRMMGLEPLMPRTNGSVTATERVIDTTTAHSALKEWVLDYSHTADQATSFMDAWSEGSNPDDQAEIRAQVDINTDYQVSLQDKDVDWLLKMYSLGMLTKRTVWAEAKRRGILGPKFDEEDEEGRLEEEEPPFDKDGDGDPDPREPKLDSDEKSTGNQPRFGST